MSPKTNTHDSAAAQQPAPAPSMKVSTEAQHEQHVQTEEEGPAARMRGGCIPCPGRMEDVAISYRYRVVARIIKLCSHHKCK
ncbi:hypothetical protein AGABI1DRAFT_116118 [Agaricus bisporus var. burnettii JB137-S8]|uniref:Uncharacterized protein n=1 Tax=Agaricus bisporus var. burnettii (strain JB137-S8 / ATCC MYA-4627 / FGSC 10392) TaxID=597362 RepID=K5WKT6_AGABU|nr:hypothetical protein AGABI2DRAFT_194982 [Agaricus bisporus var. bisporus H97]XP_007333479.1 uncharacterized protein AGABI1DRAFT_116118 [Agaricus bisporus var. burnettii JB137-S8]EKM75916.1 hypothetical protein AGABI1DRAFT_116118 [Agaricus bisporus var. burnettii JB137-S8]EKV44189.1 hypothetical protein AGABI2DRAFT_194982 [Agaricus bisporus var. bisporus H97]